MKRSLEDLTLIALIAAAVGPVAAQPAATPGAGVNAAFARLFGAHTTFTAQVDVQVAGKQKTTMPMALALSGSRMRIEVDISSVRVDGQPQPGTELFRSIGLDRVITVSRLDQKSSLIIVPGMRASVDTPMPEEEAGFLGSEAKLEYTEPGNETSAGHPCVRSRFVITDKKGRKREGLVWKATDLKDFPVQIQTKEGDDQMTMRFSDIKLQSPDPQLFVAPPGYKSYKEMSDLMEAAMAKLQDSGKK